jgi:ubiquitin carboxyl-terminal hydrolase L3
LHFVTFVEHKEFLIELDGRRNSPINHGKIKSGLLDVRRASGQSLALFHKGLTIGGIDCLAQDTVEVVKRIMGLTNSIQFNLVALSPATEDD